MRKIHVGASGAAVASGRLGTRSVRRPGPHGHARRNLAQDATARATDLSGSDRIPQPEAADRRYRYGAAGNSRREGPQKTSGTCLRGAERGWAGALAGDGAPAI